MPLYRKAVKRWWQFHTDRIMKERQSVKFANWTKAREELYCTDRHGSSKRLFADSGPSCRCRRNAVSDAFLIALAALTRALVKMRTLVVSTPCGLMREACVEEKRIYALSATVDFLRRLSNQRSKHCKRLVFSRPVGHVKNQLAATRNFGMGNIRAVKFLAVQQHFFYMQKRRMNISTTRKENSFSSYQILICR